MIYRAVTFVYEYDIKIFRCITWVISDFSDRSVISLPFFITSFYVNPLNKMLEGLDEYRSMGRRYSYSFEGDDQLAELNEGITELTEENRQYRRRIKLLKETQPRTEESE